MKKFIFSLPSLVEVIEVADDQGKEEAQIKADEVGLAFIHKVGIVKESSDEDVKQIVAFGNALSSEEGKLTGIFFSDPILNGAENVWFGPALSSKIEPSHDFFTFGKKLTPDSSVQKDAERDAFWAVSNDSYSTPTF